MYELFLKDACSNSALCAILVYGLASTRMVENHELCFVTYLYLGILFDKEHKNLIAMKKISLIIMVSQAVLLLMNTACHAQLDLNKISEEAEKVVNENLGSSSSGKLSNEEVVNGLKEALEIGSKNAGKSTSKVDGFLKNPAIRIPWPEDAQKMKSTLNNMGMSAQVEKFEVTMNRAAEEAAKEAAPIFVAAIKNMTVQDGFAILKGEDDAATQYLNKNTSSQLDAKFRPVIKKAIDKVELTKYWNPLITAYNKVPMVEKMNPDLESYITEKALAGLFHELAKEELKIRENPMARVTDLLKKVFGELDG